MHNLEELTHAIRVIEDPTQSSHTKDTVTLKSFKDSLL